MKIPTKYGVSKFIRNRISWLTPKALRQKFGWGCVSCGETFYTFGFPDVLEGKRVEYCGDCWPGYESCGNVGCIHYRCEHSFGEQWTTTYVQPGQPGKVGDIMDIPPGCMNAGCPCNGFITRAEAAGRIQDYGAARREAYWKLSEMANVTDVVSDVEMCVNVTTYLDTDTREQREKVFEIQSELHRKYPNVLFDFNVTESITKHEQS
jgi:hypothetical protein